MQQAASWTVVAQQFVSGGVLFYGVLKFFDAVGDRLSDDTRLQIAIWLLDLKSVRVVKAWPDTFATVFDRVFTKNHFSAKCWWRAVLLSMALGFVAGSIQLVTSGQGFYSSRADVVFFIILLFFSNALPDYISLLESRWILSIMKRNTHPLYWVLLLLVDAYLTLLISLTFVMWSFAVVGYLSDQSIGGFRQVISAPLVIVLHPRRLFAFLSKNTALVSITTLPAFFTSIWLWLYVASGFLLKTARRLDVGFQWFNAHFDIEKKPLQSMGIMAATVTALVYWGAIVAVRLLKGAMH